MKLKTKLIALAVASALMGSTAAMATPLPVTLNSGDGALVDVAGFDWASLGTAAIYNYAPVVGNQFDLVYYSTAASIQKVGGGNFSTPNLNSTYEITVIANLNEQVLSFDGVTAKFQTLGGTFSVYYDTNVNGSYKTGAGITDGTLLFSGVLGNQYGGSFDAFGPLLGLGISNLVASITYTDPILLNPDLAGANALSTLAISPDGGNPNTSGWIYTDITGTPGAAGASNPFGPNNIPNVILQADSSSSIRSVPEPASVALFGIALLGLGAMRRKS